MIALDDGTPDCPGRISTQLHHELQLRCYELQSYNLVEVALGWKDTVWFRLTPSGRRVREADFKSSLAIPSNDSTVPTERIA